MMFRNILIFSFIVVCVLVYGPGFNFAKDLKGVNSAVSEELEHPAAPGQKPQTLLLDTLIIKSQDGHDFRFSVEIAKTDEQKRIGMMFRESVPNMSGMLFLFDDDRERGFWMKNTYVALDLIFIKADGVVHHIHPDAVPLSHDIMPSRGAVRAVLEIGGGEAARLGLSVGDIVVNERYFSQSVQ